MKKLLAVLLVFFLMLGSVPAMAENELEALLAQKEQLEAQIAQLEEEIIHAREDDIITSAIDALKTHWKARYSKYGQGNGYLGIRYTRVVYVQDEVDLSKTNLFENVVCFVEFLLLSDYFGSAPYYHHTGLDESVLFYRDGTFSVFSQNPLDAYRSRTYSADYSDIIDSISDRGAEFNADYMLLDQ